MQRVAGLLGREAGIIVTDSPNLPEISVPMPWQEDVWQQLHVRIDTDQLPHAMLLAGPAHIGKSRLAMALARLLLCHEPVAGRNCGSCHACEMSRAGSHGDFRWLQPLEKSRVIKIDAIREVVEFCHKTASFGQRKLLVFAPAESMNPNAANALLKSLEEPADDTYMLLVCHRPHGLSATIRSRCQQLRIPSPTTEQGLEWLNKLTGDQQNSEQLLDLADGRPLLAEEIYQSADMETAAAIPLSLEALCDGRGTVPQVVALLSRYPVEEALLQLGNYLRRALRRSGQNNALSTQSRKLFLLLDDVNRLQNAVRSGANPNPQLLLESLLARFQKELGGVY